MKRTLSLLLVLVMVISMVPNVFATTDEKPSIDFDEMYYLDNYTPIEADIAAGEEETFVWTATENGTLTYEVPANVTIALTQGDETASGSGTVALAVVAGEDVTIVVTNALEEDAEVTITGTFEAGHDCAANATVVEGKAATCTEPGLTDGAVCSICGETITKQDVIPALGHTEQTVPGKAATCTETGLTDGVVCSVCGQTITAQEEIPVIAHDYKSEHFDGNPGYTKYTCSVCGDTYTEEDEIVEPTIGIIKHPENVSDVYIGDDVTFTVEANGATAYQWMKRLEGKAWIVISGATSESYTFEAVEGDTYLYACKVTFSDGTYKVSDTATYAATWKFEIYSQSPETQEVVAGSSVRLYVSAHGYGLTYKWLRRIPGKAWAIMSTDGPVYTFKAEKDNPNGHIFRCQVFNEDNEVLNSIDFTYTTFPFAVITNQTPATPSEYEPGDPVTFFVSADKENATYQWVQSRVNNGNWTVISGATEPTLTVSARPGQKMYYRCIIRDEFKNVTASNVMHYTCESNLEILSVGQNAKEFVNRELVIFEVETTLDAEGSGTRYQWLKRLPGKAWAVLNGKTTRTLAIKAEAGNGYEFACKVTDKYGIYKLSTPMTYTAGEALEMVTDAVSPEGAVAAGEVVEFNFEVNAVSGQSMTYRWLRRPVGKSWGVYKSNLLNSKLQITAKAGHNYEYMCQAIDEFGNVLSSTIVTFTVQ